MAFQLDPEIKKLLHELFDWAGKDYKESIKGLGPNQYVGFSAEDEPEIAKVFPQLRDYFLGPKFDQKLLHLNVISDDTKTKPAWSSEQKLSRAIEDLLVWVGASLNVMHHKTKVEEVLDTFEKGLTPESADIIYMPIFGLSIESQRERFTRFNLCKYLDLVYLTEGEHALLKQDSSHHEDSRYKNDLPYVSLKIEIPTSEKTDEVMKQLYASVEYFKVMMIGFFNIDVLMPIQFHIQRSPWSPVILPQVRYRKLPEKIGHTTLRDDKLQILKKYWPLVHPKSLKRYHVAANRLSRSSLREAWPDKVIDIAIAMENLIESQNEITYRLSTIIPWLICENASDRPALKKKIEEFYNLRSVVVHGGTIESNKKLKKKFKDLSPIAFIRELNEIKENVRSAMLVLILNEDLQTPDGQSQLALGNKAPFVRKPT